MSRNEELPPELPVPPPLSTAKLVLGAKAIHDAHILNLISGFVDSAVEMAFCDACKLKSVALLERIWNASLPETFPSPADLGPGNGGKWSRRKYLRTDKHYNRFQFRCGIIEAASIGEKHKAMEMVQWLYDHFHGCIVPFGAVRAAAGHGHLEMLKFFKDHEIPGTLGDDRDDIKAEEGNVVRWGRHDMEAAAENNHFDIVWWLFKYAPAPRYLNNVMKTALRTGNVLMLEWIQANFLARRRRLPEVGGIAVTAELLASDRKYFMAEAIEGGQVVVMEWLLENGHAKRMVRHSAVDAALKVNRLDILDWLIERKLVEAGRVMEVAAGEGHLEVAKDYYALYWHEICAQPDFPMEPSVPSRKSLWITAGTMICAVRSGRLDAVRWLFDTFNCAVDLFAPNYWPRDILYVASEGGNLELVKYLNGIITMFTQNTGRKRKRGKTMSGIGPECSTAAMDYAVLFNHLPVVQWLHANRNEGCTAEALEFAARHGCLEMLQWLHSHRPGGWSTSVMDTAASNGHLHVVQWLHAHRREGCTTQAMDGAAMEGYLDVVQWLHRNRSEGCTVKAVNQAVMQGKMHVVKWLLANRPEGCSSSAMDYAAMKSLEIVRWFHEHRSEGCTNAAIDNAAGREEFDVILFLHSQRREGCSEDAIDECRKSDLFVDLADAVDDSPSDNIYDWLVEHYPDAREQ